MTIHRPSGFFSLAFGALTAACLTACSAGIDVGQVTGTGTGTGTGGSGDAGMLAINPASLDVGSAVVNTTVTQTVVVTNESGADIDEITDTVSGPNAGWFTLSGVPASLPAGGQATVTISFAPATGGVAAEATATFAATGIAATTLALTGTSLATALQLNPSTIDFGFVPLNTSDIGCTTITDVANVAVTISGDSDFYSLGGSVTDLTVNDAGQEVPLNDFPIVIASGASAQVCFSMTPPITQDYTTQATLQTNDPGGVNPVVSLTGWGGGPQIFCTPLSLDFGSTTFGSTPNLQVLCNNNGTALPQTELVLGPVTSSSSAFSAQIETALPAGGLLPGQSAVIGVSYQPSGDGGDTGTLQIDTNGGQGQPVSVSLSGSGASNGATFQIASTTIDFGYVGLNDDVISCTTITDVGGAGVTISGVLANFSDPGDVFFPASMDDATPPNPISWPIQIAPGGSAKLCFEFRPVNANQYTEQGTLLATAPGPGGGDVVITLTGWGGGPQISCSPLSLDFGSTPTLQVVCSNSGTTIPGTGLTFGSLTSSSNAFSAQFDAAVPDGGLAPGASATIDVTYQASAGSAYSGTLQIDSNGGQGQPVTVALSGCSYPAEVDGGNLFPDVTLGVGWMNFTGAVDTAAGIGAEPDALLQLHCSGKSYALIDVSGAWCPFCQQFATDVPGEYAPGWLAQGGLVLTVLEQNSTDTGQATQADLTAWAAAYQTNYSLVNDPLGNLPTAVGPLLAWPGEFVVRLSDMQIVYSILGAGDALFEQYSRVLDAQPDGGM